MTVKEINSSNFKEEVLNSKKPVVIDNFAVWCGPCQSMKPIFKELSEEMKDIKFVSVDVDESGDIATQYGVRSIPTFILLKNGKVITQFVGGMSKAQLKEKIKSNL